MQNIYQTKLLELIKHDRFKEFSHLFDETKSLLIPPQTINNLLLQGKCGSLLHMCAQYNAHRICHFVCSHYVTHLQNIINSHDYEGKSPLHVCCIFGSTECAKILLINGANVNALKRGDWIPLMNAVTKCGTDLELISLLLDYGADLSLCNKDGWNSIHLATRTGNICLLSLLKEHSRNNNRMSAWRVKTKNGRTLLHIASMHSHLDIVKYLLGDISLSEYFKSNVRDVCGVTAFMDAARINCRILCELIWEHFNAQLNVNDVDNSGRSALHIAAQSNALDTCDFLVNYLKVDVNLQDNWKQTPLFLSVREGHQEMTKFLIQYGANPLMLDAKNRSPLNIAEQYGHADICRLLTEKNMCAHCE